MPIYKDAEGDLRFKCNCRLVPGLDLVNAKVKAVNWSRHPNNNIGEAVIAVLGEKLLVSSDFSDESKIIYRYVNGNQI